MDALFLGVLDDLAYIYSMRPFWGTPKVASGVDHIGVFLDIIAHGLHP